MTSINLDGNVNGGYQATTKPALHLMPGQRISVEMVGKMFKSLTRRDMTAQDRSNCEAKFAAAVAKQSIPMGHRLAGVLTEAMNEPRFVEQWMDDSDKSFRPFAATVLDLCSAKRMTEKSRRAVYQDLCACKRLVVLTEVVGRPVPPKVLKLLSRTNWKVFSRRDWATSKTPIQGVNFDVLAPAKVEKRCSWSDR